MRNNISSLQEKLLLFLSLSLVCRPKIMRVVLSFHGIPLNLPMNVGSAYLDGGCKYFGKCIKCFYMVISLEAIRGLSSPPQYTSLQCFL